MHIKEIKESLPNHFHDTNISNINIDYISKKLVFEINIWVGNMESGFTSVREEYKRATLIINNFAYFISEPPFPNYPFNIGEDLWIVDLCVDSDLWEIPSNIPKNISENSFICSGYINNWNSFIYFAGDDAVLNWELE